MPISVSLMTFTVAWVETNGLWLLESQQLLNSMLSNSKPRKNSADLDHVSFVPVGQRSGCIGKLQECDWEHLLSD